MPELRELTQQVQDCAGLVGEQRDGLWGSGSALAVLAKFDSLGVKPSAKPVPAVSPADGTVLKGNGAWPFVVRVVGDDLVCENILITCFGGFGEGELDPQDDGQTASGMNTARQKVCGVSVAMDGRMFSSLSSAEHRALDGAPIPRLFNSRGLTAWHTQVEVTINGETWTPPDGLIDLGPGLQASRNGPHALDLTPLAAQHWDKATSLRRLAMGFEAKGSFRIIGGARLIRV